jgi:hypothetical protein
VIVVALIFSWLLLFTVRCPAFMYIYKHVNHTGLFDTIKVYFPLRAYAETALEADVPLTHKQTNIQASVIILI